MSSCVSVSKTLVTAFFHILNCLITTTSELRELLKVRKSKVWTIGRVSNCLDAHLCQIVCDKDGLVYCPGSNTTDPIWRVLASSDGISSWTPLKPQHSNPNPNPYPLANQLWSIDFLTLPTHHPSQTPCFPLISYVTQKLMFDSCKMVQKQSEAFCGIFSKFKTEFYCISFF